jgi:hypothetical protein
MRPKRRRHSSQPQNVRLSRLPSRKKTRRLMRLALRTGLALNSHSVIGYFKMTRNANTERLQLETWIIRIAVSALLKQGDCNQRHKFSHSSVILEPQKLC